MYNERNAFLHNRSRLDSRADLMDIVSVIVLGIVAVIVVLVIYGEGRAAGRHVERQRWQEQRWHNMWPYSKE